MLRKQTYFDISPHQASAVCKIYPYCIAKFPSISKASKSLRFQNETVYCVIYIKMHVKTLERTNVTYVVRSNDCSEVWRADAGQLVLPMHPDVPRPAGHIPHILLLQRQIPIGQTLKRDITLLIYNIKWLSESYIKHCSREICEIKIIFV